MRNLVRVFSLAMAIGSIACKTASPPAPNYGARQDVYVPEPDATLAHSSSTGFRSAANLVVSSASQWESIWNQIQATHEPKLPVPDVDFNSQHVILVALGTRVSGGHTVSVDSLVEFEQGTTVYTTASAPGDNCLTTGVLTQPVHAVRVPISREPVTFQQRKVTHSCS